MKFINALKIGAAAFAVATSGVASAQTISPAFEYTSAGTLAENRPFTLGFAFNLSGAKTVNALGYTTVGFAQDQTIGLWTSGGTLLASATVAPTGTVVGNYVWQGISPLALAAGDYVIGGTFTGGLFPAYLTGVTTAPGYTYLRDLQVAGSGLNFPTSTFGNYGPQGIAQVNLSFGGAVPEPASWALMIGGMGLVGGALRRRSTKVAFAA